MLDTPEQIAGFGRYQAAGGYKKPSSYSVSNGNQNTAQSLAAALRGCIDPELDYARDGIQELPQTLTQLAAECDSAVSAGQAWNQYLDIAAKPDDLMQVSVGVDVLCKQAGQPNDKPAASTIPITDGSLVDASQQAISAVAAKQAAAVSLMGKINPAITPTTSSSGSNGASTTTPPPPLPADLKKQALAMIATLKALTGKISESAGKVSAAASAATSERSRALVAFEQAVSFTIIANGQETAAIKDAINEINPV